MFPLGLEAKLIAGAIALATALGAFAWFVHHERELGAANVRAAVQKAADAASAANAAESLRRQSAQQENLNEANRFNAARAADAVGLDAVVRRLHDDATRSHPASSDPAASGSGTLNGLSPTRMVPAELYLRAVDAAASAAEALDCLRGVSQLCAGDYDALTVAK